MISARIRDIRESLGFTSNIIWAEGIKFAELRVVMNLGTSTSTHILSGWKEIATYLGKGVRTVQRYEVAFRLPVRRPAAKARGSVVATREEIDAWVASSPIRDQAESGFTSEWRVPPSTDALKRGIGDMKKLCQEMRSLRLELRNSAARLGANARAIRAEIHQDDYAYTVGGTLGADWRTIHLLSLPSHGFGPDPGKMVA